MADFLEGMAIASRRRTAAAARREAPAALRSRADDAPPAPPLALSPDGFDLIAEIKRRAPGGAATRGTDPDALAAAYAKGGAAAVSVLTEPLGFDGSLADLEAAGRVLAAAPHPVPTMRKDFLVDPYQVFEARAAGAGGVLLIAELTSPAGPADGDALLDAAVEAGVWVLIEAFGDAHLDAAVRLGRQAEARSVRALVGVNVRDLRSLAVDRGRLERLASGLPSDLPAVAESGMRTPGHAAAAAKLGYRLALVGRALSGASDPRGLVAEMLRAGRAARREAAWA